MVPRLVESKPDFPASECEKIATSPAEASCLNVLAGLCGYLTGTISGSLPVPSFGHDDHIRSILPVRSGKQIPTINSICRELRNRSGGTF